MGSLVSRSAEEVASKMASKQARNVAESQDRMQRQMLLMQVSMARERLYWFGAAWGFLTLAVAGALKNGPSSARVALIPYVLFSTVTAYQWDFAYGSKLERIQRIRAAMERDEANDHWFLPVDRSSQ